jgi:Uncharacterized conserved protein
MKWIWLPVLLLASTPAFAAEIPLTVDFERSRIEYHVTDVSGGFSGKLVAYTLDLSLDPATPGGLGRAELRFRFTDLRSGVNKRDQAMRDWQNTEQFPECVFTLTALEPTQQADRFTARGQIIFHGHSRDLIFPVTIHRDGTQVYTEGEARLDVRDFGLKPQRRYLFFPIDPVVILRWKIHADAASPARS